MSNFGENTGAHVTHTGAGDYGSEGNTGTGAYGTKNGTEYETGNKGQGQGQGGGILHRSKSNSSSSSEDDGEGGRRKKSITEKIKEKLPGGNKPKTTGQDAYGHGAATTPGEGYGPTTTPGEGYGTHGTEAEKKGIMEKIKEKLPGGHPQQ